MKSVSESIASVRRALEDARDGLRNGERVCAQLVKERDDAVAALAACRAYVVETSRETVERTREDVAEILRLRGHLDTIAESMGCQPDDDEDLVEAVRLLVQERDTLRRLPVIATCGYCARFYGDSERERGGGTCQHGERSDFVGSVNDQLPPPSWCPLRGGAR